MIAVKLVLGLILGLWVFLHLGFDRWAQHGRLRRSERPCAVEVLIPARNEEGRIGAAVRAVCACPGVQRLVVVDDQSTDGTYAEAVAAADARVVVRRARPRPSGWAGKPLACAEAAAGAEAEWLLFVDADVELEPDAVRSAVAQAEASGADLLSLFGTWKLVSWPERWFIPAVGWFIRGAFDPDRVNRGDLVFANGQFILVRRSFYEQAGGHAAVHDAVLDDVGLAKAAAAAGGAVRLYYAPWAFQVRLYTSTAEIWNGYRKNLFEGLGRRPALAVAACVGVFATTSLPLFLGLPLGWADGVAGGLCLAIVALIVLFRYRLERRDGRSGAVAWAHPFAGTFLAAVLLASAISPKVQWKGRSFAGGRSES